MVRLGHRLNDIGWRLFLMLTGVIWLLAAPAMALRRGRKSCSMSGYVNKTAVSGFSVALGVAAFVAPVSQIGRTAPPPVAIFLLVIGASLLAKPSFKRRLPR
jgi:hypothetical protein